MTDPEYADDRVAGGLVRRGIARLADAYPFHAGVLEQFRLVPDPSVGTMGVGLVGDRLVLLYSPPFVLALPPDQLGGVLLHEVLHVVYGHVTADPADFPDRVARTIAEEVTVNEFIREPLPAGVVLLKDFPRLRPGQSTRERYEALAGRVPKRWRERMAPPAAGGPAGGGGASNPSPPAPAGGRRAAPPSGMADTHERWPAAVGDRDQCREQVGEMIAAAGIAVPADLAEALHQAGLHPGSDTYLVAGGRSATVPWRAVLRRFVGRALRPEPRYGRPPRRCPELAGIVPGRGRAEADASVVAVLDTSGSMTAELLEAVAAELRRLGRDFSVHVVECDADVQRVYPFAGRLESVQGGGGTDFRPPLEAAVLGPLRPGVVVFFTDGDGPAPDRPPSVPVVWCLTPEGRRPAPWGMVVRMT